jgi:hypothetical protein
VLLEAGSQFGGGCNSAAVGGERSVFAVLIGVRGLKAPARLALMSRLKPRPTTMERAPDGCAGADVAAEAATNNYGAGSK